MKIEQRPLTLKETIEVMPALLWWMFRNGGWVLLLMLCAVVAFAIWGGGSR